MKTEQKPDKVKLFASVMAYAPWLVLRIGIAYLRMKRRANRTSKIFERGLLTHGMAPEMAHKLAISYEGDLSIRRFVGRQGAW